MAQLSGSKKTPFRKQNPGDTKDFWTLDPARDLYASAVSKERIGARKVKFKARNVKVKIGISLPQKLSQMSTQDKETLMRQDIRLVVTAKTPEALAATILKDPCEFESHIKPIVAFLSLIEFDAIAAPELRGAIVGSVIARILHKPFIPIRKSKRTRQKYEYYYGSVGFSVPEGIKPGQEIVLIDDDIMRGGTRDASTWVIHQTGAKVKGIAVLLQWPQFRESPYSQDFEGFLFSSRVVFNPFLL